MRTVELGLDDERQGSDKVGQVDHANVLLALVVPHGGRGYLRLHEFLFKCKTDRMMLFRGAAGGNGDGWGG